MTRVGQRLYSARVNKSLSLDDIARATKIRPNFLAAIESGEYDKLPSTTYAYGFVKNYASFLGLSQKEISALFRREFDEKTYTKVLPEILATREGLVLPRIYIRKSFILISAAIIMLIAYLGFQYRTMVLAPQLSIESLQINEKAKNFVTVSGKTNPNASVQINNESAILNPNGEFTKSLKVFPGKSTIKVSSKNRFGKETVIRKEIVIENNDANGG